MQTTKAKPLPKDELEELSLREMIVEIFNFIKRNKWPPWAGLVTVDSKQLMDWFQCSDKTLERMRGDGRLKGELMMGSYRYKVIDLIETLSERKLTRNGPPNLMEILERHLKRELKME